MSATAVARAMEAVPRHRFVPDVALHVPEPEGPPLLIDRKADPEGWWQAVRSASPIVTQLDDGRADLRTAKGGYTSSCSAPATVAHLLRLLDAAPGNRVLEIGTGTGWTAALLSHLVGAANVTSIEIDPAVAADAARRLGDGPRLIVGDGAYGCPERAPYDRVHVTCGVRTVPYAWIEQTRPGGAIVAPYCPGFGAGHALRLTVMPGGTAAGRFSGGAHYMMMRSQRPAELGPWRREDALEFRTPVDPRTLAYAPLGADLAVSALTGLRTSVYQEDDFYRMWVIGGPDEWAAASWQPHRDDYEVYRFGDRDVWAEAVNAYFTWVSWGEPGHERFGMTVTPEEQRVWLDEATRVIG
ncbi:protein-L-isoaspartate(D-aspartate) O-methyltransferase [Nonomuraea sp. ATR24]|uniref:protein-L-isoaspartate(D-aspartate) O-methyltransferase n=1 Tax=Nonomuraea TaxID=83681 RepID=UPI0027E1117E|nr:protein-L-isoaspartate(D-aspartate) O-methyltransferase [Nonomuraea ceibae]